MNIDNIPKAWELLGIIRQHEKEILELQNAINITIESPFTRIAFFRLKGDSTNDRIAADFLHKIIVAHGLAITSLQDEITDL